MSTAQVLMVLKALMVLLPLVVNAVRDGRVRAASQQEVLDALLGKIGDRVDNAKRARDDDSLPDPYAKGQ